MKEKHLRYSGTPSNFGNLIRIREILLLTWASVKLFPGTEQKGLRNNA